MSHYEDNYDHDYRKERESRTKINILTWSSINTNNEKASCSICRVKLIPSPKANENDMMWCRERGNSYGISKNNDNGQTKYTTKSGSPSI
jgi:hypothetical protein